jgi:two-component system, NtrC family, sensor kinase
MRPRRLISGGIRRKLAWLLLFAAVVPLAIFGAAAITSARTVANEIIRDANLHIAQRAAQAIGLHLDGAFEALAAAADTLGRAQLSRAQQEQLILASRERVHSFAKLTYVDRAGALVCSTEDLAPQLDPGDPALSDALAGRLHVGTIRIDNTFAPMLRVAVPVRTMGNVVGALVAELDLVAIWELVDDIHVGQTGRALVLDEDGRLVAHGDPRAKALITSNKRMTGLMSLAQTAAVHGGIAEGPGSLGDHVVSVVVPIPRISWTLMLEQEARETFETTRLLAWLLAGLTLAAVALALVIGTRLTRRALLVPLRLLEDAAEAFARRRFDHRVALATGDELETFGATLNDMAAALARAYDDLARSERAQAFGMVAAGLAHDLKHPVGDLHAVMLRVRGTEGAEVDRMLADAARRAVPKLTAMVDQLRDLGRAGKRRDAEFRAGALLEALEGFDARARESGVTLAGHAPDGPMLVVADGMLLSRAIENLVSNALDATPRGGRVTLVIAALSSGELQIRVRDTGPGIAPEVQAEMFKPFSTSDAEKGLGLGLYVVQRVVEAHAGTLQVGRLPEGGTEFMLVLPVLARAAA